MKKYTLLFLILPNYNDSNYVTNNLITALYPKRTIIGIDVRNLYENIVIIHCVTQKQPQ